MNTKKVNKRNNLWLILLIAVFGLVYIRAMAFVYVEGDDASSMAYHVMGRNNDLQPVYAAYQGMMDKVLSRLPPQEPLLRVTSLLSPILQPSAWSFCS